MNAKISEYQITTKIYESANSIVYRAILPKNNQPIILKVLKLDYPKLSELTKYKQEYEITRSLNLDGVIKAYGLQRYQNSLAIFLEDFGGDSLRAWIENEQLALEEILFIAVRIAEVLSSIHAANIIHKDINSSNIVYNQETRQLKIIDFGISTVLSQENQALGNPDYLEGTLAYISPEQTGRMNRSIDYRTDFYSLGITLYELLTGQLPFQTTDPMELVHCHIAQQATPPHLLVKKDRCPTAVANIVMKLLAKTAEERYQTAWGLKVDLENCLHQLQTSNQILEFPLATQDVSNKFQIPQKLYGREEKVDQLLSIFERVSQGTTEMILVSGYSGIGKSALVNEVHKPIVQQRGYFISGKFDQLKRNIPYASLIQAFQDLIRQLLTESETKLQNWKQQILEALDPNSQVIIDVIPEVELIIGKQPPVPELKPSESESRFNLVLQKFIDVFAKQEHPLVIFLDDLQWSDTASLKLIERLMTDSDSKYLLIIGAYRSNEVSPTHPLTITIETIQKTNAKVNSILLEPLNFNQVNQLIAETLICSLEKCGDLAELIDTKTNGNPFFINQLLQSLYAENLLSFNSTQYCWQWEIAAIKNVDITDNVVDLMVSKIEKLAHSTQTVLKLAACIGNQFNLDILSIVNSKSQAETSQELQVAIEEGLIIPLNN
ncbi:MAG TPA: serine/threonine-protein kinase PknK, partial [Kamptonema sp.]|nr:serine/threonine-protein kinase PknK [Kamptonema sp.]